MDPQDEAGARARLIQHYVAIEPYASFKSDIHSFLLVATSDLSFVVDEEQLAAEAVTALATIALRGKRESAALKTATSAIVAQSAKLDTSYNTRRDELIADINARIDKFVENDQVASANPLEYYFLEPKQRFIIADEIVYSELDSFDLLSLFQVQDDSGAHVHILTELVGPGGLNRRDVDSSSMFAGPGARPSHRARQDAAATISAQVADSAKGEGQVPVAPMKQAAQSAQDAAKAPGGFPRNGSVRQSPSVFDQFAEIAQASIGTFAAGAFDAFESAMLRAVQTGRFAAGAFGQAMKGVASNTLKSIGQQSMAKAGFEVGEGLKSLADKDSEGAGHHFASAGEFFALGTLAGAASGAMGPKGGGAAGGSSSSKSTSPAGANPSGQTPAGAGGSGVTQNITVIGVPDADQVHTIKARFRQAT